MMFRLGNQTRLGDTYKKCHTYSTAANAFGPNVTKAASKRAGKPQQILSKWWKKLTTYIHGYRKKTNSFPDRAHEFAEFRCNYQGERQQKHMSHQKKTPTFHYTGWLIGDPYNGLLQSLHHWVLFHTMSSSISTQTTRGPFSLLTWQAVRQISKCW